ncbi:site-specific integrase [Porifericola rhodea]|uniref:site-specific integrase n=1 Tax=Porifericola rhodea TaxID=930972 RepID=UPI00266529D0|nr:site-specific integrase [Porifericola rhodea]WKN31343.1 site-specific integrase [Porifericola rhodea]
MKVSFWLAGSKLNRAGLAPIFAKITVKGKKPVNISTGLTIEPDRWQPGGFGYIKGPSGNKKRHYAPDKLSKAYNEKLLNVRAQLQGIYNDLERQGKAISAKLIKDLYTGAHLSTITLKSAMLRFIEDKKKEGKKNTYIKTLLVRYKAAIKYLNKSKKMDLQLCEVSVAFLSRVEDYFKLEKRFDQSTINKILNLIKSTTDYGVRQEWIDHNPLSSHKNSKLIRKPKVYLSPYEVDLINNHNFASQRLQRIAHLFLFQCYTGLAFVDLLRFEKSWLRNGIDGRYWIFTDRQKVQASTCRIPLFKTAAEVLEKLEWRIDPISNGNYNAYLKEIAVICGIEKNLTSHVARKTFGNLLLDQNVSLEVVSSLYGHSSTKTTLTYYVDISEKRIASETTNINL